MGWGQLIGAGAGFLLGGPAGMSIGASLGGSLEEATGGGVSGAAGDAAAAAAAASDRSAQLQRETAREQLALQQRMYEEGVQRQQPYYQAGTNALAQMQAQYGKMPAAFKYNTMPAEFTGKVNLGEDPGYAFRLKEGQQALDRQAAARGGLISGGALKAATRYGQEMGSQEYGNAYNRALTKYNADVNRESTGYNRALTSYNADVNREATGYNRLAAMSGTGQTAANTVGTAGQNYATGAGNIAGTMAANVGNIYTQQGINQGNALITGAQARSTSYGNTADLLGRFYGGGSGGDYLASPDVSGRYNPATGRFGR